MPIVILRLTDPCEEASPNPSHCPYCGSDRIHPWGGAPRDIYDTKPIKVLANRFSCDKCSKTFRAYPQGYDRSAYSLRIRRLAALIWLLDLSIRDVSEVFLEQGITMNRMTIWREGMKLCEELNQMNLLNPQNRYSIDKEGNLDRRPKKGVVLMLSLAKGKTTVLGTLNSMNSESIVAWLKPILEQLDIQVDLLGTKEFSQQGFQEIPT